MLKLERNLYVTWGAVGAYSVYRNIDVIVMREHATCGAIASFYRAHSQSNSPTMVTRYGTEAVVASSKIAGLVIEWSRVQVPAGAAREFVSLG